MRTFVARRSFCVLFLLFLCARVEAQNMGPNLATAGIASQTSDYGVGQFPASLGIDGNTGNFTHTLASAELGNEPPVAIWEVDLQEAIEVATIVVHNRDSCCQSRFRDLIVSIHETSFEEDIDRLPPVLPDPDNVELELWPDAVFETELLNPENALGGPAEIVVDVEALAGGLVEGQYVRVSRIPDLDLSGTGGAGNNDEATVLSLGEVEVFGEAPSCPEEGDPNFADTHCLGVDFEEPPGGGAGVYEVSAQSLDDTGDGVLYTFTAESTAGTVLTIGPAAENLVSFDLGVGNWTVTASVDDSLLCPDAAADASCTTQIIVDPPEGNCSLGRPAMQSTVWNNDQFPASLATDGNTGNFTHTATDGDLIHTPPVAIWEVDLERDCDIAAIVVHNRGGGCCQSRLRDIVVSIHDHSFVEDLEPVPPADPDLVELPLWGDFDALFESDVLNPENVLGGGGTAGPPSLTVNVLELTGGAVTGRYVRVSRIPDRDLSGTGGGGNTAEPTVLSLGEVEVLEEPDCPALGDSHCDLFTITTPLDGDVPGQYLLEATGTDDSGDAPLYTFRAVKGDVTLVSGPSVNGFATFDILETGTWTFSVSVDDDLLCSDRTVDAVCEEVIEVAFDCPDAGDTHCAGLEIDGPGGFPGDYRIVAEAVDESAEPIIYTFVADNGVEQITRGPQAENFTVFSLAGGETVDDVVEWTITVSVDDQPFCADSAVDATCTETIRVQQGIDLAPGGIASQSSQLGAFEPSRAIDGDRANFTHTLSQGELTSEPPVAIWELELPEESAIGAVVIHNRTSCCGSRLRDLIVSVHDVPFADDVDPAPVDLPDPDDVELPLWPGAAFESELLNPENESGVFPLGPAALFVDLSAEEVVGRYVRISRIPDMDLSGSGGAGNPDEATVLSLGEVQVFESRDTPPPPDAFKRGDTDASGVVDISDPIFNLQVQFVGGAAFACRDAADVDDSGVIDISDPIYSLQWQFVGGIAPPSAPGPTTCGPDPSADGLECAAYPAARC